MSIHCTENDALEPEQLRGQTRETEASSLLVLDEIVLQHKYYNTAHTLAFMFLVQVYNPVFLVYYIACTLHKKDLCCNTLSRNKYLSLP